MGRTLDQCAAVVEKAIGLPVEFDTQVWAGVAINADRARGLDGKQADAVKLKTASGTFGEVCGGTQSQIRLRRVLHKPGCIE